MRRWGSLAAFLDTWTFAVQLQNFFEVGEGRELLGTSQHYAIDSARESVADITRIGGLFLPPDQLAEAEARVVEFASANSMGVAYSRRVMLPSTAPESDTMGLNWILEKPLAPFTPLKGLDETATAVREFAAVADMFSRTV